LSRPPKVEKIADLLLEVFLAATQFLIVKPGLLDMVNEYCLRIAQAHVQYVSCFVGLKELKSYTQGIHVLAALMDHRDIDLDIVTRRPGHACGQANGMPVRYVAHGRLFQAFSEMNDSVIDGGNPHCGNA